MASYTYDQFREVLKKLNFENIRSEKHETWRKILPNGVILRVRISHRQGIEVLDAKELMGKKIEFDLPELSAA